VHRAAVHRSAVHRAAVQRAAEPGAVDAPASRSLVTGQVFVAALLVLVALLPVVLLASTPRVAEVPGWWLALVILLWSGVRLAQLIAGGRPRLLEFTFWLFAYVFMGLAPLVQMRSGVFPSTTPGIPLRDTDIALFMVVVSLGCTEVGLWTARQWTARPAAGSGASIHRPRTIALGVAGVVLAAYYVSRVGLSTLWSSRLELSARRVAAWPDATVDAIVGVCAYVPLLVSGHALVRSRRTLVSRGRPRRGGVLAAVCLLVLLMVVNPISSPRYVVGTVLLSLVVLGGGFATATRTRVSLAVITFALVVVFPYADVFRTVTGGQNQGSLVSNLTVNGDYDAFAQLVNTVEYVRDHGSTNGRQLLGVLLFWVPRSLWPGKPTDTGVLLAESNGYGFTNLSAPIWSEMYINAAWPGIIVFSLLLGLVIGRLSSRIESADRGNGPAAVFLGILAFYLLILLRGSLLQAMANLSVLAVCSWLIRGRPTVDRARPG
jgi:hypothetical protein